MKRLPALLAALALLSAPALADCRFGAPRARLRDGEIRFSTAVDSDLPVYLVTAEARLGGAPLEIRESGLSDVWHGDPFSDGRPGPAVRGFTAAVPEGASPEDELTVRLVAMTPYAGIAPVAAGREEVRDAVRAALAEELTPVRAEEPWTVCFAEDRPGRSAEAALAAPPVGAYGDPELTARLADCSYLMIAGRAAYSIAPDTEEDAYAPQAPVLLRMRGEEREIVLALQDDGLPGLPGPRRAPEDAARAGIAALQAEYALADDFLEDCIAGYTFVEERTDGGPRAYWAVNLWQEGLPTDHTAFVDAETGEVLDTSGPGEGNG